MAAWKERSRDFDGAVGVEDSGEGLRLNRIAFYQGVFRANYDGTMTTMARVVDFLSRRGISQLVLTPILPGPEEQWAPEIRKVRSFPFPLYPRYHVAIPNRREVWKALDDFEPDIVQVGTPDLGGKCALEWAKARKVPVVGGYHTHFPTYLRYYGFGFLENYIWKDLRVFYESCAATLVPSQALIRELTDKGMDRLFLWPRGVDLSRFNPALRDMQWRRDKGVSDDDVLFVYAGRLVAEKNVDEVAKAFALLRDRCERAKFMFLGDGPRSPAVRRLLPDAIFPGYIIDDELSRAYASSDVFCFASSTESFGNVGLEAMASGLPTVTLAGTPMGDRVEESGAGLLVDSPKPESLAQAMETLYKSPELRAHQRTKALEFAAGQDWETLLEKQLSVYEELLSRAD